MDRRTAAALRDNGQRMGMAGIRIVQCDAMSFLGKEQGPWDLVFLDPPYDSDLLEEVLPRLADRVSAEAIVYCETRQQFAVPDCWVMRKRKQLADTCMTLLEAKQTDAQV